MSGELITHSVTLHVGDCRHVLPSIPSGSLDAVICDPPYPCIKRAYGYWTEAEWFALMDVVVPECRRVLKPTGSAVFILQPNSERVGRMRMWFGQPDCYRDQDSVLWNESDSTKARLAAERAKGSRRGRQDSPSRHGRDIATVGDAVQRRGGVSPYNVLPMDHGHSQRTAGAKGHSAGTPLDLMQWWVRYICPPGGTVLDCFAGSGTTGKACESEGRKAVLIEESEEYADIIRKRLKGEPTLFSEVLA